MSPRRLTVALIALAAAVAAAPAVGATSSIAHQERDYAGSGLARLHGGGVPAVRPAGLPGLDVSSWQGNVDWLAVAINGGRFAYVKATEGTSYVNPYFTQQYVGAFQVAAGLGVQGLDELLQVEVDHGSSVLNECGCPG